MAWMRPMWHENIPFISLWILIHKNIATCEFRRLWQFMVGKHKIYGPNILHYGAMVGYVINGAPCDTGNTMPSPRTVHTE